MTKIYAKQCLLQMESSRLFLDNPKMAILGKTFPLFKYRGIKKRRWGGPERGVGDFKEKEEMGRSQLIETLYANERKERRREIHIPNYYENLIARGTLIGRGADGNWGVCILITFYDYGALMLRVVLFEPG